MKRLAHLVLLLCCLMGLMAVTASAESMATRVDYYATVNVDGDCMVTMTVNLHLEESNPELMFPLPGNADKIVMNGSSVPTTRMGSYIGAHLSKATGGSRGDFSIQFAYTLSDKVSVMDDRKTLKLELPILCGFEYPIQSLNYTITLPRDNSRMPDFISTYRQSGIASDLNCIPNGSMITGSSKSAFNDHEALFMYLQADTEMFPGVSTYIRDGNPELIPMGIFAGIALLYWLICLRNLPFRKITSANPPAGVNAGELGCRLTMSGTDLTMMVFHWAQMGYILIHVDRQGRVLLHKRMDMGNERSLFEVRVFQTLFGEHRVIDATGNQYAKNRHRAAALVPGEKTMCKSSGSTKIFRGICCVSQVFCGICVAMNMTNITVLQVLLSLLFGALGVVTAWGMQEAAYCTYVRGNSKAYIALGCVAIWGLLGLLCKQVWIPLGACAGQLFMGFFAAYGGRRTDMNRLEAAQILGLRRYMKKMPKADVPKMLHRDPDFFFRLAPYAMALGVLKPFAQMFGKRKMDCPYLIPPVPGYRRADEWGLMLVTAADRMDARFRQMEIERWLPVKVR